MNQPFLFPEYAEERIVNVASVPHRSPFRYPGGKTWLVPHVRRWLGTQPRPSLLVEPFAGGATVGLTAAFENLADRVLLVELDPEVAAVWQSIFGGDAQWLADRIMQFGMDADNLKSALCQAPANTAELAFQTILKNRTNHGGILAPGSGTLRHGESGKGLLSRWYPETLARRILLLDGIKDRIEIVVEDGIDTLARYGDDPSVAAFIDPPYTAGGKKAGSRLYTYFELDHERLFEVSSAFSGDILMTYDDAKEIRELSQRFGFSTRLVPMKNTHHAKMTELLIGRKLSWAGQERLSTDLAG